MTENKRTFAKINKVLVEEDRGLIESYIKRHQLDSMKVSGTGLYYLIWGNPKGDLIKTGNVVEYQYKISLLDGTVCYQSENNLPKQFKVGQGGVEYGLEQAVLLMRPGQKGKFILPPHLAYGLIGDGKKIPARSIIIYDVEMLNVYK
jgi:FKBP-type peptidyl-prolyl cis-trans isomerase FkpA